MTLPRRYLLVDDNQHDHFLAQAAFEQLCPECQVTCVGSGRAALDLMHALEVQPDVVLLDLNMPEMNGFEVLQAMKADAQLVRIPVVILSTSNARQDVELAYSLHASSYLVKSSSFSGYLELLATVLNYWQSSRTAQDLP